MASRDPKKRVLIIGAGIIGGEAKLQFAKAGYDVIGVINSRQLERENGPPVTFAERGNADEVSHAVELLCRNTKRRPHLAVFALPSGGKNAAENEIKIMQPLLARKVFLDLAGKAALSKFPEVLAPYLHRMGVNATVGGATKILDALKESLRFGPGHHSVVELVINGTLSYIQTNVWANRSLEAAIREAVYLKYADPGINRRMPNPVDVFCGEAGPDGDIKKKLLIILNTIYREYIGRFVKPEEIKVAEIDEMGVLRVTDSAQRRKYVVRISTKPVPSITEYGSPGFVHANIADKVFITGGFATIPVGSALDAWVPNCGPGNAVHIVQDGRQRIESADGAGSLATVGTLLDDAHRLCSPD